MTMSIHLDISRKSFDFDSFFFKSEQDDDDVDDVDDVDVCSRQRYCGPVSA